MTDKATVMHSLHDSRTQSSQVDSWALVERIKRGDRTAFDTLYLYHRSTILRYALNRVKDTALAEDIVSETFLRALGGIGHVTNTGKDFQSWLLTIARNAILDHYRSARHRYETTLGTVEPDFSTVNGPEHQLDLSLLREQLAWYLTMLNDDQRYCVVSRFWFGRSVSDTAERMKKTPNAVRALQYRAVRRLQELFVLNDPQEI